jgi:pimeloyl-ACP methyl ester carboxylesterase
MRDLLIRDLRVVAAEGAGPAVVLLPGLGAPWYLRPLVGAFERRGRAAVLLDLPGFGAPAPSRCEPDVRAVGERAARWCAAGPDPVVLFGHSTGAQAALHAALVLQEAGTPARALVLAGPTPAPGQRSIPRLLLLAPLALRRESLAELGVLRHYLRGQAGTWRLLRSGVRDRPERTRARLRLPVLVTAGRADSFAPPGWLDTLAGPGGRVVLLPGSHNNPFTHPDEVAGLVDAAVPGAPAGTAPAAVP